MINIINFTTLMIAKNIKKHIFIATIFMILVFLLSSVIFVKASIQEEIKHNMLNQPDIVIQNIKGGRVAPTNINISYKLSQIIGIKSVHNRIYGWYKFENANKYFSIVGIDFFDEAYSKSIQQIVDKVDAKEFLSKDSMILGSGVKEVLSSSYYKDFFNFITSYDNKDSFSFSTNSGIKKIYFYSTFTNDLALETNDLILVDETIAREILNYQDYECSDIAMYVHNKTEIPTIVQKIQSMYPTYKIILKDDLIASYQNLYDYKGGFFLSLFIVCLVTFVMILFFKASAITKEEKKEIAILRSIGWSINHIISYKVLESVIVSLISFLFGLIFALLYVYFCDAYLLDRVFFGYSNISSTFKLLPIIDMQSIAVIFFATVPLYVSSTLIPAYKSAVGDISEVLR